MCDVPGCESHYGCRLRSKGIQVGAKIHANQRSTPQPFRPAVRDSVNGATATDDRGLPLIRSNLAPLSRGEARPIRHTIADGWARQEAHAAATTTQE